MSSVWKAMILVVGLVGCLVVGLVSCSVVFSEETVLLTVFCGDEPCSCRIDGSEEQFGAKYGEARCEIEAGKEETIEFAAECGQGEELRWQSNANAVPHCGATDGHPLGPPVCAIEAPKGETTVTCEFAMTSGVPRPDAQTACSGGVPGGDFCNRCPADIACCLALEVGSSCTEVCEEAGLACKTVWQRDSSSQECGLPEDGEILGEPCDVIHDEVTVCKCMEAT